MDSFIARSPSGNSTECTVDDASVDTVIEVANPGVSGLLHLAHKIFCLFGRHGFAGNFVLGLPHLVHVLDGLVVLVVAITIVVASRNWSSRCTIKGASRFREQRLILPSRLWYVVMSFKAFQIDDDKRIAENIRE